MNPESYKPEAIILNGRRLTLIDSAIVIQEDRMLLTATVLSSMQSIDDFINGRYSAVYLSCSKGKSLDLVRCRAKLFSEEVIGRTHRVMIELFYDYITESTAVVFTPIEEFMAL